METDRPVDSQAEIFPLSKCPKEPGVVQAKVSQLAAGIQGHQPSSAACQRVQLQDADMRNEGRI